MKVDFKVNKTCFIVLIILFVLSGIQAAGLYAQPAAQKAPVPEVVAIPRPSADEVAFAERALKRFFKTTDPATKRLNKKYPDLISVREPRPNTAIVPNLAPFFRSKHMNNLQVAGQGNIDVLFMGDSITDFWRNTEGAYAGKPVMDKYFGDLRIANFGIAGDTTQGVLYRLMNGEGKGFSPKAVMLMIGTNNTMQNNADEIAEGIGAVVLELQKDFPEAKILLLAVFPRSTPDDPVRDTLDEINRKISKLHDGGKVYYMDIGPKFLDEKGFIPADVMSDGLHPSAKGYEIWAEAVNDKLRSLLK